MINQKAVERGMEVKVSYVWERIRTKILHLKNKIKLKKKFKKDSMVLVTKTEGNTRITNKIEKPRDKIYTPLLDTFIFIKGGKNMLME